MPSTLIWGLFGGDREFTNWPYLFYGLWWISEISGESSLSSIFSDSTSFVFLSIGYLSSSSLSSWLSFVTSSIPKLVSLPDDKRFYSSKLSILLLFALFKLDLLFYGLLDEELEAAFFCSTICL